MSTLSTIRHGPNAALWASLAPGDSVPDEIQVTVQLGEGNTYGGHLLVLFYGTNRRTGQQNSRRTSKQWRFAEHNIALFLEEDVRALLRARRCRS